MYLPINCFRPGSLASCAALWEELAVSRSDGEHNALSSLCLSKFNNGSGITCDISTSGIFFETESEYSTGDMIRLFLNFEQETLQCEARVVRVEPRHGQFGVAAELTSYVFC